MSYQAGMIIPGETKLGFNGVFYKTKQEAKEAGNELMSRWFVPIGFEIIEKPDAVNYKFNFQSYKPEMLK